MIAREWRQGRKAGGKCVGNAITTRATESEFESVKRGNRPVPVPAPRPLLAGTLGGFLFRGGHDGLDGGQRLEVISVADDDR